MKSADDRPRKWRRCLPVNEQIQQCRICRLDIPEQYLVFASESWRVRHSLETDIAGYCLLEPQRHFLDLSEASVSELTEYSRLLAAVMKALREILRCRRVYTFSLAEAVPHFHQHIIPIAEDFSPLHRGRGILSYPGEPVCDPELVAATAGILRTQLCSLLPAYTG
jgi:diadenosine tetraphosphate (Ap4A) HIT family hydrolase